MNEKNRSPRQLQVGVFGWLLCIIVWCASTLFIVGVLHQNNNYGLRKGDYELQTISAAEFSGLSISQQNAWNSVSGTDVYVKTIVKNPFVLSHVTKHVVPVFVLAIIAFGSCLYSQNKSKVAPASA